MQAVRRFRAIADDGEEFDVVEYRSSRTHRDLSGDTSHSQGLPTFRLSDGSLLNQIDAETFQILDRNKVIRKLG